MPRADRKQRIFSALEVANVCGVVNQTAINWIKSGYLKAFTTPGGQYRVYPEDLAQFLHGRGMRLTEELEVILEEHRLIDTFVIVDDDADLNNLMAQFLREKYPTIDVQQALDGYEAGKVVAEYKPGLILLDIELPGIDGFKLCKSIKNDNILGNPVVIGISAYTQPEIEEEILSEGADAFLTKPIDLERLPGLIDELGGERMPRE